jgi:predicted ATPase
MSTVGRPSAGAPSHNLPPRPRSIVGRERDLASAREHLLAAETRLLTLVGPPGVGKTRLAVELAAAVLDASTGAERAFPDGAWFVDLAPIADPRLVADATARSLGLGDVGGRAPAEMLVDYLREKALLLILDNFEQVLDAAELVGRLLAACPRLKIVATSRAPLHLGWEREQTVQPLPLPDPDDPPTPAALAASPAVRLFVERARIVVPGFAPDAAEVAAVAEVCRQLDGLPLAIELAAARVKLFSASALARRLAGPEEAGAGQLSPLHLLAGRARDVPARQQTLWNAIAWSYDLLPPDEQALFRRLSVFVGGCTVGAGSWVLGDGVADDASSTPNTHHLSPITLDLIDSLVDKSLVVWVERPDAVGVGGPMGAQRRSSANSEEGMIEPRLHLLETLREFGQEQLRAVGELESVRRHHADYYLALAERAAPELSGPDQVAWLDRLEPERANLLRVLEWSAERGEREIGLRLGAALWPFWLVRGHSREARARFVELATAGRLAAPSRIRAGALVGAAILARHAGDYATSRALLEEALGLSRELADAGGIAQAQHHLGWLAYLEGDLDASWSLEEQSLEAFRALGDTAAMADVLHGLGGEARALHNLGLADALILGELPAARRQYEASLEIFRELGDRQSIAMALGNLGDVALLQHDYDAAQALHHGCLVTAAEVDDRRRIAFSLAGVAVLAASRGQAARALRLAAAAMALREAIGAAPDRVWQARLEPGLAAARAQLGRQAAARIWAEGAAMTPGEAMSHALGADEFGADE